MPADEPRCPAPPTSTIGTWRVPQASPSRRPSSAMSGEGYVAAAGARAGAAPSPRTSGTCRTPWPGACASRRAGRSVCSCPTCATRSTPTWRLGSLAAHVRSGYTMMLVDDRGRRGRGNGSGEGLRLDAAAGVIVTPVSPESRPTCCASTCPSSKSTAQFLRSAATAVIVDNAKHRPADQRSPDLARSSPHRDAHRRDRLDHRQPTASPVTASPSRSPASRSTRRSSCPAGWDVGGARKAAVDLLARRDQPTAVFSANNVLAEGVWRAASDLGLRVPEDVSIVSFDDAGVDEHGHPGSPRWRRMPWSSAGRAAIVCSRASRTPRRPSTVVLDAEILPRGSTAAPRPACESPRLAERASAGSGTTPERADP